MRGKVAKRIRKKIYHLQSLRLPRRYETLRNGAIRNIGLRRAYLAAKKEYKQEKRNVIRSMS